MSRDPRATARACFTLARQGATEGERSAALNRGMAIIERHKLDADHFDIPGRVRGVSGKRADRFIIDDPWADLDPHDYSMASFERRFTPEQRSDIIRAFEEAIRGSIFAGSGMRKPETATQQAERRREESMAEYVRRTGS